MNINSDIIVLIPMAGGGRRFTEQGYVLPKPLINVNGKPMIQAVVESLGLGDTNKHVFITRDYDNEKHTKELYKVLKGSTNDCYIISIPELTRGAAETCLKAKELINNDNPLIITNCDQIFDWDVKKFLSFLKQKEPDGAVAVFSSRDVHYSYIKVNDCGIGIELAEKNPISNLALVGFHYWKRGLDFIRSAETMIANKETHKDEYYVAPTYNYLIKEGKKILPYMTKENMAHIIGTPEELEKYLNKTHDNI